MWVAHKHDDIFNQNYIIRSSDSTCRIFMQPRKSRDFCEVCAVLCSVAQSCATLCLPVNCNPPGFSIHRDSPDKNTRLSCHTLLQGIFPTQASNPGLLHCREIFFFLPSEPPGKPKNTEVGNLTFLQGIFPTQKLNWGLLHCKWIL